MLSSLFKRSKGPYKLYIEGREEPVEVPAKTSILQAALDNGIPFPHSCRAGGCGTCRCRLVEGRVRELTDKSFFLSAEELQQNYILACQSLPRSDVRVRVDRLDLSAEAAATVHPVVKTAGRIAGTRRATHDILELTVDLDRPMAYTAGQYADLSVPGVIDHPRSFSFAAAPESDAPTRVVFHARLLPDGVFSGWLAASDRLGHKLHVEGPHGDFWLRPSGAPILCLAGSTGMAPIKALLEQALRDRVQRDVVCLFGARTQRDLYCLDEMAVLERRWRGDFRFEPVLSEEPPGSDWEGRRGLVTEHLTEPALEVETRHAYMCGPPPMLDAALGILAELGVAKDHIHFDKFLDRSHTAVLAG
ncbi:MAG TPA: 2Fe-2S iron-sulfur cluster binding domain-containing protein [Gammaproteobacteria bacterium]|nr:2Fe-2S iron-sulfur cluster binding domain-containing protein [Gammaproteobacteria bacterium]